MSRLVLTLEETATLLGTSVKVVRKAVQAGTIRSIKIGRKTLVLRVALEQQLGAASQNPVEL
jgi:excisionase family DNA binding protein